MRAGEGVVIGPDTDLAAVGPEQNRPLIVSPHLDDAVLSCGRMLDAHPGTTVVTVFAGTRGPGAPFREWDRICGFGPDADVVAARREEDRAGLATVRAAALWVDEAEPDGRADPVDEAAIVAVLDRVIAACSPSMVLIPLGIHHVDHVLVHGLVVRALRTRTDLPVVVFQEMPYDKVYADAIPARLRDVTGAGLELRDVDVPVGARLRKFRAVACYPTQLRGLGGRRVHLGVTVRPERYWAARLPR